MGKGSGGCERPSIGIDSNGSAGELTSKDSLGDRMKGYENHWRFRIPERSWTMVRLDGRAFHTWTQGLERPFDTRMMEALATCTAEICATLPGCQMAYVQSDEITIVLEDFSKPQTQAFFGGGVQKMTSVLASEMTARFGRHFPDRPIATFDARVWTVPNKAEACAALIWRQQDARRNAISMLCEHYFTPEQLHAVSLADRKDMLIEAGVDLESVDARFLHGQAIMRQTTREDKAFIHKETGEELLATQVERTEWVTTPAPTFDVSDAGFLRQQLTVDDPIEEDAVDEIDE